jgi:hypothetical protein
MLLLFFAFVVGAFVAVTCAALLHCSLGCWLSHAALSAAGSLTLFSAVGFLIIAARLL